MKKEKTIVFTESDCAWKERVYYAETDAGGVVYYANYLVYLEKARTEWMRNKGLDVVALAHAGTLFVVSSVAITYKSPARYADIVKVYVKLTNVTPVRLYFDYCIKKEDGGMTLCEAQTVMVCINKEFKPTSLPDRIHSQMEHESQA